MKRLVLCLSLLFSNLSIYSEESSEQVVSSYRLVEDKAKLPLLNPSLAQRKVAKIVLANGLEAYLVSDPGAEQSAAGIAVEAGSWADPAEYPGMAHFCEHMLFMGTKAYPKEFEYMQFVTDNGGKVNAYTASDRTVYMFSINDDAFSSAFDRFAHFFIDPLFSPSCIARELHAVDQEHSKNIENDGWRQYMILKETGNQQHPNAGFSTGNAKTLGGIPQSALKDWYQAHYSANRMHLAVISPMPLDELTALAVKTFSAVPDRHLPKLAYPAHMTSEQQRGHLIYIKPIKDLKVLSLTWEMPAEYAQDHDRKVDSLIAYVLSSESDNSFLKQLKREKIVESLSVSSDRFSENEMLFNIDITLTDEGLKHIDRAILTLFDALANLKEKGIPASLFEEMRKINTMNYQFQSRDDAFSVIANLASGMMYENLATYPEKSSIPTLYDPQFIKEFASSLTPESCVYFVIADPLKMGIFADQTEKWMNAQYAIKEIDPKQMVAWTEAKPQPGIGLPPPNLFIPSQFNLVSSEENNSLPTPELIADDEICKVYFAQDRKYLTPDLDAIFSFKSPLLDGSAKSYALADLYLRALNEKISSTLFFAGAAGLTLETSYQNMRLSFEVSGYSQKAPLLLTEAFKSFKSVQPTKEEFAIYKQSIQNSYQNSSKDLPLIQAVNILSSLIFNDSPSSSQKLAAIKEITYDQFIAFSKNLFEKAYMEGIVYGNTTDEAAVNLIIDLKQELSLNPYPEHAEHQKKVLLLPEKHGPYMVSENTKMQGNGVVLLLEEGDFSFEKRAAQQVLATALQDGFFDTLRTKQQTAYMAKAWNAEVSRQLLQFFGVQSSTHHPSELLARFELFIEDFNKNLKDRVSPTRFENMRAMLIKTIEQLPENMPGMTALLETLAFEYNGDFAWLDKKIESTKALTYEVFSEYTHEFLSRDNARRLAILMEGTAPKDRGFHYEEISKEDIPALGSYVSKQ